MSETKRTRLTAVYLTSSERDLVVSALDELNSFMGVRHHDRDGFAEIWAKSFTSRRIRDLRSLFLDKKATP
jgi:hypothetical protein